MPLIIVIISTILATGLLLVVYIMRFVGLHRKTYQINPLSPIAWLVGSLVSVVFLLAAHQLVLAGLSAMAAVLQVILIVWSFYDIRQRKSSWKMTIGDFICAGLSGVALLAYVLGGDVEIAAAIAFGGYILAEIPQLHKDFYAPQTDSVKIYLMTALRNAILLGALHEFDFVGLSQTIYWSGVALLEAGWLLYCRNREKLRVKKLAPVPVRADDAD
jgi:hypothetical protein